MKRGLLVLALGIVLTGCGKHYWEAPDRGVPEFESDSSQCIQEAKTKYEISERIYRGCMRSRGWARVQVTDPTDRQFRGPEEEDEFYSPPNPLSERGVTGRGRADDPACTGATASRPSHCARR